MTERIGIGTVWALAVVGALVSLFAVEPEMRETGIGLTLAGCVIATFALQLATGKPAGYLFRATASVVGAVIIVALADLVGLVL